MTPPGQKKLLFSLAGIAVLTVLVMVFYRPHLQKYRETKALMGGIVKIDACFEPRQIGRLEQTVRQVWARLDDISQRMDRFQPRSEMAAVNRSFRQPVEVGRDTYGLLKRSVQYTWVTKGAFDITAGALTALWSERARQGRLPTGAEIAAVRASVGSANLKFGPRLKVECLKPGMLVDIGGDVRGFAVDEAARVMRTSGFKNFLVDAGGNLYASGKNCNGDAWTIAVPDPMDRGRMVDIIKVSNAGIATSGIYGSKAGGGLRRPSGPAVNPATGMPVKGVFVSAVIAPSAEVADALASALSVMGGAQGIALINMLGPTYASVVLAPDGNGTRWFLSAHYGQYQYRPRPHR